jgi:signal transduction histidine kinase
MLRTGSRAPAPASRTSRREAWIRVGAIVVAVALLICGTVLGTGLYGGALLLVFPLVAVQCGALVLGLVRPRVAAIASLLASLGLMLATAGTLHPWPWSVTTLITQALVTGVVAYRVRPREAVVVFVAGLVLSGVVAAAVRTDRSMEAIGVDLVVFASIDGVVLVAGIVLQRWRLIREQLVRERSLSEEERAGRLVAEERTRIARELHDVIAHSMAVINVQASSAPFRLPAIDAAVRAEFEEIAVSSRRALAEMRSLLSVLRDDGSAERAPQPGLSSIPELVERVARSGTEIRLSWEGADAVGVDRMTELAAYRIVQEAVSNAIRHAPGAAIAVSCAVTSDAIRLEVVNGAGSSTQPTTDPVGGSGLVGMGERVASLGGTWEHREPVGGGYLVRASLPLGGEERA